MKALWTRHAFKIYWLLRISHNYVVFIKLSKNKCLGGLNRPISHAVHGKLYRDHAVNAHPHAKRIELDPGLVNRVALAVLTEDIDTTNVVQCLSDFTLGLAPPGADPRKMTVGTWPPG